MTEPKRKRGRPRKFRGDKDRATFADALEQTLPVIVEFIVTWQQYRLLAKQTRADRRADAVRAVAAKHGWSERTLERRYSELRFIAEPIAAQHLAGQPAVALEIEQIPQRRD